MGEGRNGMGDPLERLLLRNFASTERAVVAEMIARVSRAMIGTLTVAGVLILVNVVFRDLVTPWVLDTWLASTTVIIATPLMLTIAFAIHGPSSESATRPYVIVGRLSSFALSALIAASIWILLPTAGDPLRYVMIVLYVTFVAMMLGADASPALMVEQLGVMASTIAFVLAYRMPYAVPLAIVLAAVVISLVGFHRMVQRSARDAIAARAETERANAALETALKLVAAQRDDKTRFIAAASHDLRQPLQAASLYFDHALTLPDGALRDRAVAGARSAFLSTQGLLETMLDHLRLEADALVAKLKDVAVAAVFARVALEHQAEARGAGMRIAVIHGGLAVQADADLLKRVLGNLMTNAVRHAQGERILVAARRRVDLAELWVIDDGHGVAEGDRLTLFDDYTQGNTDAQGGFGIGLASARRMVALMGGTIAYDPRWTGGAAFVVRLPLAARAIDEGTQCEAA